MIDTIILQIAINYSAITNHSKFKPSTRWILNNPEGFSKYVNNPTKEDRKKGIYKPRLTIIKRKGVIYLKIEFSAPKMLFNNNLDEVEEGNFEKLAEILQKRIEEMGVKIFTPLIKYAEVISFHPSKNIPLTKGYTSIFAIRELAKINLNKKFDLDRESFRNNGEALQLYTNSHSVVLYDKINDLNKPAKRAIDKDQTKQQINLFEYIKREKRNLEVLKIEVRLSRKDKMKEILEKVGFTDSSLFKNIFKKDLCQKILKFYWDSFFNKNQFLFSLNNNPQKILELIFRAKPKARTHTAVLLVGLHALCKDEEGFRGFKNIIYNHKPKTNFQSLEHFIKNLEDDIFKQPQHEFIKDIEKSLNEFKAFKLNK